MGGINISQKHNLINNPKSPSFYTLISVIILTILTIIAISIKLSFSNAAGEAEGTNDTAIATLNNVDILQAGTGQSVTIKGETLNENDYGTDNATRRTILNNNIVRYNANYNVTKVGQITFSITLPANNTIDEATIAESQGCLPNLSKLESADITNSDGTITKSYTNNKATCVRNITTTGSTNWQITAYLWGANNTKIQPTLAVSGQTSTVRPEEISVVGRGDYGVRLQSMADLGASGGYNQAVYPTIGLYANVSNETGVLGIAPLTNGDWRVKLDTSNLPKEWTVLRYSTSFDSIYGSDSSISNVTMAYPGGVQLHQSDDGSELTITWSGAATAVRHCQESYDKTKCYYSGVTILIGIPSSSLTQTATEYAISMEDIKLNVDGYSEITIKPDRSSYTWWLQSSAYGNPLIWGGFYKNASNIGWDRYYAIYQPIYTGEVANFGAWVQLNTVPLSVNNIATNLNFCTTFNPDMGRLVQSFEKAPSGVILSGYKVQYGIIGTDMSVLPSSSQQYCGKVGDENIPGQMMFFDTLEEANQYAKDNNLAVNAMRLWSAETRSGVRNGHLGTFYVVPIKDSDVTLNASGTTNEWDERSDGTVASPPASSPTPSLPSPVAPILVKKTTSPSPLRHITRTQIVK